MIDNVQNVVECQLFSPLFELTFQDYFFISIQTHKVQVLIIWFLQSTKLQVFIIIMCGFFLYKIILMSTIIVLWLMRFIWVKWLEQKSLLFETVWSFSTVGDRSRTNFRRIMKFTVFACSLFSYYTSFNLLASSYWSIGKKYYLLKIFLDLIYF